MINTTPNLNFEKDTLLTHTSRLQNRRVESSPNTEEEAYQKAIQGYKYPFYFQIGSLDYVDLVDIGYDPPNVDLETYKALSLLDKAQLLKKAAGIERLYPTITKKDLFFYLTRGRLTEDQKIGVKLERLNKFEKLITLNQNLILLIYKTPEDFATASESERKKNLESIIFLYDELMGIPSTPGLISRMLGIELKTPSSNVDNYLYWKLYRYLEVSSSQTPSSILSNNRNSIEVLDFETVIGFNVDEWKAYIKKNYASLTLPYESRSDFILREFYDLNAE